MRGCWLLLLLVILGSYSEPAAAQAPWPARPTQGVTLPKPRSARNPGSFAQGAAIFGTVSAGLLLGGAIAIAAVDDVESERITRGVWLGVASLSPPIIALGGWSARKRAKVQGYKSLRLLGWSSWSFAVANGILQGYEAFHDESQPWGLTVGLGALGVLATLPLSFDAFVCARRARMRGFLTSMRVSPFGLSARF